MSIHNGKKLWFVFNYDIFLKKKDNFIKTKSQGVSTKLRQRTTEP